MPNQNNWEQTTLGDLAFVNPKESIKKDALVKHVSMDCVDPFTRKISRFNVSPFRGGTKFRNGDTLMARITPCLENGKTSHVDFLEDDEIGSGSTEFIVLREKTGTSDGKFLYYLVTSPYARELAIKAMSGTSGRQRVQTDSFIAQKLLVPSLEEQKSIAAVLSSLDDKIELLRAQNNGLEEMAQRLFKEWFMGKDWAVRRLGDLTEVKRGGSPRPINDYISTKGLRWLKISDASATPSPFIFEIKEHIKEEGIKKTVLLKAGSLVLSNSATPGVPKILAIDSCIHDGWLYFPKSKLSNEFLYLLFQQIRPQLIQQGSGSIFTNLKTDILKNFEVPFSDDQTLEKFDLIVKSVFEKIWNNESQIQTLSKLRDTMMPKLMSGSIRPYASN